MRARTGDPDGGSPGTWRAPALLMVVAALVLAVAAPGRATVPDPAELDAAVEAAQARAAEAEAALEALAFDLLAARDELVAVQGRLDDAEAELRMREGQLILAERELGEREQAAATAASRSAVAAAELAASEAELVAEEARLDDQAALSFMHGTTARPVAMLQLLEDAEDPGNLAADVHLLSVVLDEQVALVDRVDELRRENEQADVTARRQRLAAAAAEVAAADAVALVTGLRDEADRVRARQRLDRDRQAQLLASLEVDAAEQEAVLVSVRAEVDRLEVERAAAIATATTSAGTTGEGPCPVDGAVTDRDFSNDWGHPRPGGRSHEGTDIFARSGTPARAIADGTVKALRFADEGLGGRYVSIWVGPGEYWYYAHLESVAGDLRIGAQVTAGQLLGTVGNTGNARGTPPHLHIGHYLEAGASNPYPVLAARCR